MREDADETEAGGREGEGDGFFAAVCLLLPFAVSLSLSPAVESRKEEDAR